MHAANPRLHRKIQAHTSGPFSLILQRNLFSAITLCASDNRSDSDSGAVNLIMAPTSPQRMSLRSCDSESAVGCMGGVIGSDLPVYRAGFLSTLRLQKRTSGMDPYQVLMD